MEIKVIGFSHFESKKNGKMYTNVQFLQDYGKTGQGQYGRNYFIPHCPELKVGDIIKLNFGINSSNKAYVSSVEIV